MRPDDITPEFVQRWHRPRAGFDLAPWQARFVASILRGDDPRMVFINTRGRTVGRATVNKVIKAMREDLDLLETNE